MHTHVPNPPMGFVKYDCSSMHFAAPYAWGHVCVCVCVFDCGGAGVGACPGVCACALVCACAYVCGCAGVHARARVSV